MSIKFAKQCLVYKNKDIKLKLNVYKEEGLN